MTEEDYSKLVVFLAKNQDVFSKSPYDLPGSNVLMHRIETGDAQPVRARMFRTTPQARQEIEKQIDNLLKHGIIEESFTNVLAVELLVRSNFNATGTRLK